eukprot:CAMPEP_0119360268 /NCGR_PEP_ID=MMETSP1334-20130426/7932_1 /TAXON_ID=127549 /ORGANISM="Calcidiscus leptoporus, Strain RCC1130" /LENGTH=320 /DNA_ID=CAMNT_0007375087 /DNA_START=54 /DNA_END=1012 /DNA_ORIENTATION=+
MHASSSRGSAYHVPVLLQPTIDNLLTDRSGTYLDCTLGGGGHSEAILDALTPFGGSLISTDRDKDAIEEAGGRLASHVLAGRSTLLRANFASLPSVLRAHFQQRGSKSARLLDGILLDLGVSSHQLDEPTRGFSYRFDGPLDMRMDQRTPLSEAAIAGGGELTAARILNEWSAPQIATVLWRNGEERQSRSLARALVAARPLQSTSQLAAVLERTAPGPPKLVTKRLARVFQALRIEVNREMDELEAILAAAAGLVRPGGRLAVLSYHSLEDGRVKRLLRSGSTTGDAPPRDAYGNALSPWFPITRQPIVASNAEIELNA